MPGLDRKAKLLEQKLINGIDFVAVDATQTQLDVYFLLDPTALTPALPIAKAEVSITGEDDPLVPITTVAPAVVGTRNVLRINTAREGGYGRYWLTIANDRIDPFFRSIEINFKAACPRDIDCAPPEHLCPPETPDEIVVDGSARDFWSLRRALLEFANQRNPRWQDRLEADVGVMLVEIMASLGDELAFYQDRVSRETQFDSANQRRSVRRHSRLVDYELHDGHGASGWIAVEADTTPAGFQLVPAGKAVWARSEGGRVVGFETGANGLEDVRNTVTYRVHNLRNKLPVHLWEGDEPDALAPLRPLPATCLPVGARRVYVSGHVKGLFKVGEPVFLVTEPPIEHRELPIRRVLVTLTDIADEKDPLGTALGTGAHVTRLDWAEPLPFEMDMRWMFVLGNAVPITAGVTTVTDFSIGENTQELPVAIERVGANGSIAFLHTLPVRLITADRKRAGGLPDLDENIAFGESVVRLGRDLDNAAPEIDLVELALPANTEGQRWSWRRALIGSNSAEPEDTDFTLDDGTWQRAVGYRRLGGEIVHYDYIAGVGTTIRFGDGEFGRMPAKGNPRPGEDRFFRARYRLGNGVRGNVPADAIRWADPNGKKGFDSIGLGFIKSITNPLATSGGVEPETLVEAKRDAPAAFRTKTFRAVRPEDYNELAERLSWVQRAGTQFRWTGSWLTAFTTADPAHVDELPADRRTALTRYLDRFRMAGREVHVLEPKYADLELEITICVEPDSYAPDVRTAVMLALIGRGGVRPIVGFFAPDHFTFGTPLDRSELESAVQRVAGVRAVKQIVIARRGRFAQRPFVEAYYQPGRDEVIRVESDPRHPDRGSVQIRTEGGA